MVDIKVGQVWEVNSLNVYPEQVVISVTSSEVRTSASNNVHSITRWIIVEFLCRAKLKENEMKYPEIRMDREYVHEDGNPVTILTITRPVTDYPVVYMSKIGGIVIADKYGIPLGCNRPFIKEKPRIIKGTAWAVFFKDGSVYCTAPSEGGARRICADTPAAFGYSKIECEVPEYK